MADDQRKLEKSKKVVHMFNNAYTAWVVLLFGFILTGAAWYTSNNFVNENAQQRFNNRVNEITAAIHARMIGYEQVLWGGVGFFNSVEGATRGQFHDYVLSLNIEQHWPGIQGIGFSIPVTPAEKAAHIEKIRAEGFPKYTIKPETNRDEYSAIIYLEPFDWRNKRAFGYDMWSNAMRRQAMTRARDLGVASTSGIITLVQETKEDVQKGFLTYVPLYRKNQPLNTVEERRKAFLGWVYSPFRMGDLMKGILGSGQTDVEYEIFDGAETTSDTLLYDSNKVFDKGDTKRSLAHTNTTTLELQGRKWTLYFTSGASKLTDSEKSQPTMVAIGGLTVNFLLFYIISSLVFLQRRAGNLAQGMTVELRQAKENLEEKVQEVSASRDKLTDEIEQRKIIEDRLKKQSKQLSVSNADLEQFAYVASHDLKAPLRAIDNLATWIEEDLEGNINGETKENLGLMRGRINRMEGLLDGLLQYARIGHAEATTEQVETKALIGEITALLDMPPGFEITTSDKLPVFETEKVPLERVFLNLIGNAVKHNDQSQGRIDISVQERDDDYEFIVADNGPGIPQEYHEKVFAIFQTLRPRDEVEGSGMGLALVKKTVEHYGGTVCLENSVKGQGASFRFTWKR